MSELKAVPNPQINRYWVSVAGVSDTGKVQFDSMVIDAPDMQGHPFATYALEVGIKKQLADAGRVYEELTIINFKLLSSGVSVPLPSKN